MSKTKEQPYKVIIPAAGSSRRLKKLTRDAPKSLLNVAGQPIIYHSLDVLDAIGLHDVVLIVGFQHERLRSAVTEQYKNIKITYAHSEDYATTEHGWSVYQARKLWQQEPKPVILMDADNLYEPGILQQLLDSEHTNVCLVDADFAAIERAEELVTGKGRQVRRFLRALSTEHDDCIGGFVGINKFSAGFMHGLFEFMQTLFSSEGRNFKYERVLDRFVTSSNHRVYYEPINGLPWINVNHEADLTIAQTLACAMREFVNRDHAPPAN